MLSNEFSHSLWVSEQSIILDDSDLEKLPKCMHWKFLCDHLVLAVLMLLPVLVWMVHWDIIYKAVKP